MADDPDTADVEDDEDVPLAKQEALADVARQAIENYQDVDDLETRLDTMMATLAELVKQRESELADEIEAVEARRAELEAELDEELLPGDDDADEAPPDRDPLRGFE